MQRHFASKQAWLTACIVLATLVLYWRRPDAFYNPQLWAEDGRDFFTQAYFLGPRALSIPYAGYYHLLARLTAAIVSWLPVLYAPHAYTFASWLMLILIISYLFSRRFLFSAPIKFLLGLTLVASTADNEMLFNIANWATITTIFWILLAASAEATTRTQKLFDNTLLVLTGLNSPFVVALWPVFGLRWWRKRTTGNRNLLLLSLLVAGTQVWNMPSRVTTSGLFPTSYANLGDMIVYRFGFMFLGEEIYQLALTAPLRFYGLLAMMGFYGWLFHHAFTTKNRPMFQLLVGGTLATLLSIFVSRHINPTILPTWGAGRHYYIQAVVTTWALLIADFQPMYKKWIPLTMMFIAFLFLTPFSKQQVWHDLAWAEHVAACTGTQPKCYIPIHPLRHNADWQHYVTYCIEPSDECRVPMTDLSHWFVTIDSHIYDPPTTQTPFAVTFANQIELLGYDMLQAEHQLELRFVWHSQAVMQTDYKLFVHLLNTTTPDEIITQIDTMPMQWQYPTSLWLDNEIVIDDVLLPLDNLPTGTYQLSIGWYNPESPTFERLIAFGANGESWAGQRVLLPTTITIQ